MPLRNAKALTIRPFGVCDAIDGTNAPPGAMAQLVNLIPNPANRNQYVCRPASVQATNFTGFSSPGIPNALLVIGNLAWGMIPSALNAGKDQPFCYNLATASFVTISNMTSANTPTSPSTSGDWTPPAMVSVTNGRIIITHPGYNFVGGYAIGWIDISSFSDSSGTTGSTHTSKTIDTLSTDVITVNGWQVGYKIAGTGIPANTYITSINAAGTSITISNAATSSNTGVALTVTGGTPTAPLYGAGQTSPTNLTALPTTVAQFNGRAYYAVANALTFSDPLLPTQVSGDGGTVDATIVLGDSNPVTALAPLPLTSTVTGGVTQALIAFKGAEQFYQITGDATTTLSSNAVPSSVGTVAANTICGTPTGLAFIAPDGLRFLTFYGQCTEPIGANGDGIAVPFLYAINPTRMCMAYNQDTLRVSVQNGAVNGQPVQEYWYNMSLKSWSGPHSFPAALIQPYYSNTTTTFVAAGSGVSGALWTSSVVPTANSTYTENSVALTFAGQTILLPDNAEGAMNTVVETTWALEVPNGASFNIIANNELGEILDQITVGNNVAGNTIWDAFLWGSADWGGTDSYFQQIPLDWTEPLVFKQTSLQINGTSQASVIVGNIYLKYQRLGYIYGPPVAGLATV